MISIDASKVIELVKNLDFPRVFGSEGENRAFEIISEEIEKLGIPVVFEEFPSTWVEFSQAFVDIGGEQLPMQPLISPLYNTEWLLVPKSIDIEGTLTDAPILEHETECYIAMRRDCDIEQPCTPGASAQLFVCPPEEGFVAYYLACDKPIPSAYLDTRYKTLLSQSVGSICRFHWDSRDSEIKLKNMSAEIKGAKFPEEVIVVGAHIDSWLGTVGASDNASGSVMLVEFARWFVRHPPVRTVRFIWFTGEELDRRGSRAYVKMHSQDEDTIRLYVNVDSGVSYEHGKPYATVVGATEFIRAVEELLINMKQDISVRGYDYPADKSKVGSSDEWAFQVHGIPTVAVYARREKPYPHPHLPTDRFDKLDAQKMQLNGGLSLSIIDAAQQGRLPLGKQIDIVG